MNLVCSNTKLQPQRKTMREGEDENFQNNLNISYHRSNKDTSNVEFVSAWAQIP